MPRGIYKRTTENKGMFKAGHIVTEVTKDKNKQWQLNRPPITKATKEKCKQSALDRLPHSKETIEKIRQSKLGDKNPSWQNGKSFELYGLEFNEDLKEVVRNRDRRKCQICGKTELENKVKLSIHHKDYDKKNNNPDNLISLCIICHIKTNRNRKYWINYFYEKSCLQ